MDLVDHLAALRTHAPGVRVDAVVAHEGPAPSGEGAPLPVDRDRLEGWVDRVHTADLLDAQDGHDPGALAAALLAACDG